MENKKKIIFSGVKPSGIPSIGNYLGAIRNWRDLQHEYNCLYCVVDLHALTERTDPKELKKKSMDLFALYIALGIDPDESIIYYQSHVPEHTQLTWILNCYTYMGELNRMTQYKEKSQKNVTNLNAGLFTYPVLMAADILLFQTDLVPVGEDQKQHLEIARDIGERFNNIYGNVFTIPDVYTGKTGARIMGLQDPTSKMSKTADDAKDAIFLLDEPDVIMNKIKRSITDSDGEIYFDVDKKPGISNLLNIYSSIKKISIEDAVKEFGSFGYGDFKKAIAETVIDELTPAREKFYDLMKNKDYLDTLAVQNAAKASSIAQRTLKKVYKKIGLYQV